MADGQFQLTVKSLGTNKERLRQFNVCVCVITLYSHTNLCHKQPLPESVVNVVDYHCGWCGNL